MNKNEILDQLLSFNLIFDFCSYRRFVVLQSLPVIVSILIFELKLYLPSVLLMLKCLSIWYGWMEFLEKRIIQFEIIINAFRNSLIYVRRCNTCIYILFWYGDFFKTRIVRFYPVSRKSGGHKITHHHWSNGIGFLVEIYLRIGIMWKIEKFDQHLPKSLKKSLTPECPKVGST